jgi:glucose/arabinose dehydrogenase
MRSHSGLVLASSRLGRLAAFGIIAGFPGCSQREGDMPLVEGALAVQPVVTGLQNPLYLTAPAGDDRLFVVEQPGRIRVVRNGALLPTPYLDIGARISSGGERGLLGLAFHPSYATNGYFYVDYTDASGDTRIERYRVSADPDVADPASASLVLAVDQPYANHNGGMLLFGRDGMLYVGMGDGGSGGDPNGNGQNPSVLLGKLLRLDVDHGTPYAIPADNPYAGRSDARPEIWAIGLRNPWRFAFDRVDRRLYVADVGQNAWEEVDVVDEVRAAVNYGWNAMEGNHCYGGAACEGMTALERPVLEYGHGDGCSITGGFVYRGSAIPSARGHYFYSDYCEGWLRSFRLSSGAATDQREWDVGSLGSVLSFGEDARGELYILSASGTVFRIVSAS